MKKVEPELNGVNLRLGIVMSRFNPEISAGLLTACREELLKHGVTEEAVTLVAVPGALEIPVALQKMANSGKFDALIALGAVIRGETYHFEIVANQSASGMASVQLDSGVPVANAVLTTLDERQARERMGRKGAEAARVAIEMANLLRRLDEK
ncbi:MAG TPA: 6,7-dimethyl-8-ribityllumazine synthase [Burkholderiales bacterium]|nr:6,7-dimethyl-8-ribityllumazine synthase [Burkholderiales bacterium]